MSTENAVRAVPRAVIGAYFRVARFPLDLVARVTGQDDNDHWPPALALSGFEGGVDTVLGGLLRDETLVKKGQLQQARVAQLRKAQELRTVAEQERVQADQTLEERRDQARQRRKRAERDAERHEQEIERRAEQAEQRVRQTAAQKKAAARQDKAAQDKAIERRERSAKAEALAKEAAALDTAKQTLDAEATVEVVQDVIESTKAARKSS
jgi:hypothetical protein